MNFKEEVARRTAAIEQVIEQYLPARQGFQKELAEAVCYSMTVGGKRIRPLLMMETYRLFGGSSAVIEPFMAAMEMIHTHSLVHDDLPAIDNDEFRRGKATTHKVYGEALGILSGDALLNLAYETAAAALGQAEDPAAAARAMQILAAKTGIAGMLGGQTVDVAAAGQQIGRDKLEFIYRLKTSALIEAAMMIGAVLAGASAADVAVVEQIATDVGMAFQIRDDMLDVTSTTAVLGKPILSDEKNEKTTYVTLVGLDAAAAAVAQCSQRAVSALAALPGENDFLKDLINWMMTREK